jgi:N-acetylglucosamine-6-phosphate deacetylase
VCVQRGVTVSAAHTDATFEQVRAAIARGLRQATHTFNAMRPFGHREPGTVGAVLTAPEVACELIADNIHVHPAAMQLLVQAKGPAGVILITDAVRVAGLPEGDYQLDTRTVSVRDGAVRLPDGALAGSTLTMDRALRNLLAATGRPLAELWPTTSRNAARAIGLSDTKGSLAAGMDADLVLLDSAQQVCATVVGGEVVYARP